VATGTAEKIVDLKNARVEIPGASLVTKDNIVVTPAGTIAKNDVIPASAEAPKSVLIAKNQLPKQTVNIDIAGGVFKPSSFTVKPGALVSFAITSADGLTHVVIFNSAVLGAIAMGIGPNETKAITFNAPTVAGEYEFRCDVPGHRGSGAGEIGKMIVK
jgi:plastocyanin